MSKRIYHFQLPYSVSGIEIALASGEINNSGILPKLPKDLQSKITNAENAWSGVTITKEMCDEVDDKTWAELAKLMGLQWSFSKVHDTVVVSNTIPEASTNVDEVK